MPYDIFTTPPYIPAMKIIAMLPTNPVLVGTMTDHGYSNGIIVRFHVTDTRYGMTQINGLSGVVTVIDHNTFTVNIDATGFDPIILSGPEALTPWQVVPIGSINTTLTNLAGQATSNVVPDVII